ncbi:MAG TPA: hypothetical protein VM933_11345 [Acidimicrobiales bacterium]|nr:hypothetical protein [Acidimicrobiales bacterium]
MGWTLPLTVVGFTVATTVVLLLLALAVPDVRPPASLLAGADDGRPRIRLLSRVLFTRRNRDAITIDCLLVSVEQAGPGVGAPAGLPFTLQFRAPDTTWFADRVEQLLTEWSAESRELTMELREDHGKVSTMIASGASAVHLELAGAAGLSLTS